MELAVSYDLETFGLDPAYGRILCASVKPWNGELYTFTRDIGKTGSDDAKLVADVIEYLNQFSIHITFNGVFYDKKYLNGRALANGQDTVIGPSHKQIDPYQIARLHLNLKRNSLDAVSTLLNLSEGKMHLPPDVWVRAALDHDKAAYTTLIERCESDVRILEEVAKKALPMTRLINAFGSA